MKNNVFKRIAALIMSMIIIAGACLGDAGTAAATGLALGNLGYNILLTGSNVTFRNSDGNVVSSIHSNKHSDVELSVMAETGYVLPESIKVTPGVKYTYDKDNGTINISKLNKDTVIKVDARKAENKLVDAYLYYRYSNTVPEKINIAEDNANYGPNGNGVSNCKVKVDLAALESLGYAKGKYKEGYIYSVENNKNTVNSEAANTHNSAGVLREDSKVRDFWKDLYSCMDAASKKLVDDTYNGKFLGYVIKETNNGNYKIHIDGIMDVQTIPTYQTELYDKTSGDKVLVKTNTDNAKAKYSSVYSLVADYLGADAENFSIVWEDATHASYTSNGKIYELTLSQVKPDEAIPSSDNKEIKYHKYTESYYVAEFAIKSKLISINCNANIYNGDELIKTFESGSVKSVADDSVATYTDIKAYIEEYLLGDATDSAKTGIDWSKGVFTKDDKIYDFSVETVSATESTDQVKVLTNTDEKGSVYYAFAGDNTYVSDIKISYSEKNVTAVGLYVLKKEASNISYGYDVDSDSIIQRPVNSFNNFGYAYVDNDYIKSIKKGANSTIKGETITESLLTYDKDTGDFEASGEKYETGKIVSYIAFTTSTAQSIVDKINDNYNIMWYVIKNAGEVNDIYKWHIDGYLVKDESEDKKIQVTVQHDVYNNQTGEYELLNNGADTVTETVSVGKVYSSKSIYPRIVADTEKKITIDGSYTDWSDLPSYWVPAEFNKTVSVNSGSGSNGDYGLGTYNLVKMYNDNDNQNIYLFLQVSDMYETFFKTDGFRLSVNNGDYQFGFKIGDADGQIIDGDISDMAPGAYDYYIYDEQGNRISGASATVVIGTNHYNTSVELCIPYDVVTTDSDDRYFVTGFEKISGTVINENSKIDYDDEQYLAADSQLAYEDTVLAYHYASKRVVETIQFETINIEGTSTSPYILALIGFAIAILGFAGVTYTKKHVAGRN